MSQNMSSFKPPVDQIISMDHNLSHVNISQNDLDNRLCMFAGYPHYNPFDQYKHSGFDPSVDQDHQTSHYVSLVWSMFWKVDALV